ncbi:hypothetical protein HZZ13_25955 [Bradyrhizobium sp. CNPSo 4010]|uniref:Polysaccharide chain length determinant N-terminal domain-containing protein n=1 Tax=Bradyrhizobium agreste TaxID=2751811 RepID=A0ABS0PVH3_9BRAD|nr:hypothetical protein [Bradyrhizobium agreste]MBH5401202.1 hypothetical protein [Bradyrhizobium agreste]
MSEQRILNFDPYLGGLLLFFVQAVRKRWLLLVGMTAATIVLAFLVASRFPPAYEAQVIVRGGRLDGAEPMNLQALVSQVNSSSFKQRVAQSMGFPDKADRSTRLISSSLAARPEGADAMLISVQAADAQDVQHALAIIVRLLNEDREGVRASFFASINAQLAAIDAHVSDLLQTRERVETLVKTTSESNSSGSDASALRAVWLLNLMQRTGERLAALRAERLALESRLGSWRTYPAALIDGAFVTPRQVSPRPIMAMFVFGGLTLLAGLLYALIRQSRPDSPNPVPGADKTLSRGESAPC